jgi:pimeloyl-ACP methyl ester carboxylesterase
MRSSLMKHLQLGVAFLMVPALVASVYGTGWASAAKTPKPATVVETKAAVTHTKLGNVEYRALGRGPALVLIMGYAGTMQTWDPHFVDTLALHFRVITFDNAGIGNTAPVQGPLSIDKMADQTGALITALHLGVPDVLGWSMGSMIAQALAIRHPSQVRRLILCATFPGVGNAVQPSQKDVNALTGSNPAAVQADLFPAGQTLAADAFDGSIAAYPSSSPVSASVIANQKSAILSWFNGRDPSGRRANQISVPTLVADGANDRIDASANDHDVAAEIPDARLVLYPDAGHAFLFQEGESFILLVRTFFSGVPISLDLTQIRQRYLVNYKIATAAGTKWVAGLKKLTTKSSAQDLARLDLNLADSDGAFDDELLGYGATGILVASVKALVSANELVARDVLAFAVLSGSKAKELTATIENDGKVELTAENVFRRQLGLSPITAPPTTTTKTKTTTIKTLLNLYDDELHYLLLEVAHPTDSATRIRRSPRRRRNQSRPSTILEHC